MTASTLPALPIDALLPELVATLREHSSVVLQAPPGAGKSTRVPPALLDAGLAGANSVLVLEPRRVAARATAARIARERGVPLGEEVGYQVRFDNRTGPATRLAVITEGILTRRLQGDPLLEGVGVVILDEFHERSLHTDLGLAFLKDLQAVRDDLKLVVMSATLATEAVARYLDCPTLTSQGRAFDVAIEYRNRPLEEPIPLEAARAVRELLARPDDDGGDVLVFMPGQGEIHACIGALEPFAARENLDVLPLYSALPPAEQDRALEPGALVAPGSRRKVVVATNIAETSLTLPGVTTVVDSGQVRELRMSPSSGLDVLELTHVSRASAEQRAGRAGRVRPGRALRLWTRAFEHRMADFDRPEIARVDITAPILEVIAWSGRDPRRFDWFEAPPEHAIERAVLLLEELGAIEFADAQHARPRLTDTGRLLLGLPAHPRLGRMLVEGARRGCLERVAAMAAIVAERDFVQRVAPDAPTVDSDLLLRAELLDEVARGQTGRARALGLEVHVGHARAVREAARQLARAVPRDLERAPDPGDDTARDEAAIRALALGYPDRVCIAQDRAAGRYAMVGGEPVVLARECLVRDADVLVAPVIAGQATSREQSVGAVRQRSLVRQAARLEVAWLDELYPGRLRREVVIDFDPERERVMARERQVFDDIGLSEKVVSVDAHADPARVAALLAARAAENLERAFGLSKDDARFLDRLACLRRWFPELEVPDLLAVDTDGGSDAAGDSGDGSPSVLLQICWGKRSFDELRRVDLPRALRGYLSHEQLTTLDEQLPDRYTVPSGSQIRLDYSADGEPPVLAVRIQEMFGLARTPTIARGRIPLLLHLLAPNYRPVQVTGDLESFWANTYPEIRKEYRARYPRHPWPEDPLQATAIRK